MAWVVAPLTSDVDGHWIVAPLTQDESSKRINITSPDLIVDIYGSPITHTYQYWYLTQTNIDLAIYNNNTVVIADKGTNFEVTAGEASLTVNQILTVGSIYTLVAFDDDYQNYVRYVGTVAEV